MAFIRSYAAVEAIGRLGRDAQIRTTSSGKQFTTFSLAVTERAGKEGAEKTQWFDVSYFGSVEPRFVALLKTGTLVFVRGELPVKTAVTDKGSRVYTGIRAHEEEEAFYGPFLSQEEAMEAMAKENIPASR